MASRDEKCFLSGISGMDEAYLGTPEKGGKRGRGTTKTSVLAALSLDALRNRQCARLEAAASVSARILAPHARAAGCHQADLLFAESGCHFSELAVEGFVKELPPICQSFFTAFWTPALHGPR
jgi:hypothetical protein